MTSIANARGWALTTPPDDDDRLGSSPTEPLTPYSDITTQCVSSVEAIVYSR